MNKKINIILVILAVVIVIVILSLAICLKWGIRDTIITYGVFLGPAATIFAVTKTITYNSIKDKEERRLSIKPYLSTNYSLCTIADFKEKSDDDVFVVIEANTLSSPIASNKIADCIINLTEDSRTNIQPSFIDFSEWPEYQGFYHFMNLSITNIGAGNAINMDIEINDGGFGNFHIKSNHTRILKIAFDSKSLKVGKPFSLNLHYKYWDVASIAHYEQTETLNISRGENKIVRICQIGSELLSKPIKIED